MIERIYYVKVDFLGPGVTTDWTSKISEKYKKTQPMGNRFSYLDVIAGFFSPIAKCWAVCRL